MANGLSMNDAKTQLMVLCRKRKQHLDKEVQVQIREHVLPQQETVKYLGVVIDKTT